MRAEGLNLTVAARPENLAVVRQAFAGFAEAMGFDQRAIADLKTILTEACMNVVVHAYPETDPGPLEVSGLPAEDGLEVVVRDQGVGLRPRPIEPDEASGLGLGLPLIATLSDGFEIRGGPDEGTEVRMLLRFDGARGTEREAETDEDLEGGEGTKGTVMSIAAGTFVRPVLARVISALAARADFSVDRISDTVLVGDAVSAHDASDFRDGTVGIEIMDVDERLDVRIGPMVEGSSERILEGLELPGGTSLRKLASDVSVRREPSRWGEGEAEYLLVRFDR